MDRSPVYWLVHSLAG